MSPLGSNQIPKQLSALTSIVHLIIGSLFSWNLGETVGRVLKVGLATITCCMLSSFVIASGAASGGSGFNQSGQMYMQGKIVFFKKLACDSGCPLTRSSVSRTSASTVLESLKSKNALKANKTDIDNVVSSLSSDEGEQVAQYLTRRFDLS